MHGKMDFLVHLSWMILDKNSQFVQYVDDTFMIMLADNNQLLQLEKILNMSSSSTGLHVNFHQRRLVLINIDNDRANA
jgi:hypothetical protein